MKTEDLTNEPLRGIYKSNFELAKHGIELWRYFMHSGREVTLPELMKILRKHPEEKYLEELKAIDAIEMEKEEKKELA